MKNIFKCMSYCLVIKSFITFIFITSTAGLLNAQNQRIININNEASLQNLIKQENHISLRNIFPDAVEKFRPFEHNPQLINFTASNQGDILLLDFFDNKKYKAVVQKVTVSYDGITGITAKILDTGFGYCYISISEKGISISADIPQQDEQFFVATKNGKSYLSHCKMSEMKKNELGCADIDLHEHENAEHAQSHTETDEIIVSDASDCTFPPDALSDSLTINVLIVYTNNAEQWALSSTQVTDINDLINQAIQRNNIAMENSLTNITFNLVHKYKTDYVEVNSNDDLYNLTNTNDGHMDEVHDLRKQYKADLVMIIPEVTFTGGVAWLLNYSSGMPTYGFGLSRVQQTSWTYTMVHEMGHNMGCGHHWRQNFQSGPGVFAYSSGYRGQNISSNWYSTIMTYENGSYFPDGNTAPRIAFFSDPDIIHDGVNIGRADSANNALTLRQTKHVVSRYSDYFVPGLKCLNVSEGTLSPVFHTDTTAYTITLPSGISTITVYATPSHPSSTILTGTGQHSLSCGQNNITVTVRTPTNVTKSYTINVIRTCEVIVSPSDTAICTGGSATLNASGEPGATFQWYDSLFDGTLLHTGENYTVFPASTTHYYVSQTVSGVESERTEVIVTVVPFPNAPTAINIAACYRTQVTHTADATAGANEIVIWYTDSIGGTVTTAPSRNAVGTTTAYAAAKSNIADCESATRTPVSVTVYAIPNAPTANDITACYDGTTYTAGATAGENETIVWYTTSSGGTTTTTAPSRSAVGTTTAYAAAKNNIAYCESTTRTAVTVTVNALPTVSISGNAPVCVNSTNQLTGSPAGGTWKSLNTGVATVSGGTVSGVTSGTVTIRYIYTNGNGCTDSAEVSVTVNALPTVSISGNAPVCINSTNQLTGLPAGGTWKSLNTGVATVTNGTVSGIAAGVATIRYIYTNGNGCIDSAEVNVTVNVLPTVSISGNSPVCVNSTNQLTGLPAGGTWKSLNTGVATVSGGTVSGLSSGVATIRYIYTNGNGCTDSAEVSVTVNALPIVSISGNSPVCGNSTNQLTGSPAGGTWKSLNTGVATVSGGTVSGIAAGVATIRYIYTDGNGCTDSAEVSVTVNALPTVSISGNTPVCVNSTNQLTGLPAGGTWKSLNTGVATVSGGTVSGVTSGTATIRYIYTNGNGCTDSAEVNVTVNALPTVSISGNAPVCVNSTNQLTGLPAGGTWKSLNTGVATVTNGTVIGIAAGVATIRYMYTNGNGCTDSAEVNVTVNTLPTVSISGNSPVCVNSTNQLTGLPAGGTWKSLNTGVATVDASGLVAGVTAGMVTIRYIVGNGSCADSTDVNVTVNSLPTVSISGNSPVCVNSTNQLTGLPAGGNWKSLNTGVATVTNGTVSGVTSGTATIRYIYTNGNGCTDSAEVSVTINPAYNINIYDTICIGESYSFNGNSYDQPGVYPINLSSVLGCDSIVTLNLEVLQSCNTQTINVDNGYYEL
ncbi:MAG: Ig-like domain-containing protein, partial [Prevotellaceae bacterium]|nr:Ig-like domain-containing protein [Prevotellaceae bacterium]